MAMGRKRYRAAAGGGSTGGTRDQIEALETRILLSHAIEHVVADVGTRTSAALQLQPQPVVKRGSAVGGLDLAAADTLAPRVIGSSIQQDGVLPSGNVSITIQFDEPIKTSNIDKSDFELANIARTAVLTASSFSFSTTGDAITVNYLNVGEDRYTFKLSSGNGQFEDVAGNDLDGETTAASWPIPSGHSGDDVAGGNFSVSFEVDVDTTPFPALQVVNPDGGTAYSNTVVRRLGTAGDHDSYTISLDSEERLSAVVEGAGLQLRADVLDPQGRVIASASAAAPGKSLLISSLPIALGGRYTITVSTVDSSVGNASLTLAINRIEGAEDFTGVSDDTQASAQNLDTVLAPVVAGASGAGRIVVHGFVDGQLNDVDYYRLTLDAGDTLSAAVYPVLLTLLGPSGNVIALSRTTPSASAVIADYTVPVAGTYYLRAETTPSSARVAYNVLVMRNVGLDVEANDSSATAQELLAKPIGGVQTYVGTAESDIGDQYRLRLKNGIPLHVVTATPGDAAVGEPVNTLKPLLRVYDATGLQVAVGDYSAPDGHNAWLTYMPTADGVYYLRIGAGILHPIDPDYLLSVTGATPAALQTFTASSASPVNNAKVTIAPTAVQINFNNAVDFSTLQPADLTIDGVPASSLTIVDADSASFTPGVPVGQGTHTIAIAAGAVSSLQGTPLLALTSTFLFDSQAPRVVSSSIQENGVATAGNLTYTVKFDERLLSSNLDATDFTLRGNGKLVNYTPSHFALDSAGTTLTLDYTNVPEDHYTLTLLSGTGRLEDALGNDLDGEPNFPTPPNVSGNGTPGGNFIVNFDLDNIAGAPLTPFTPISPPMSLAYQATASGLLNNGLDTDTFTLNLDPGQTLALQLNPTGAFRGRVDVLAPNGTTIASGAGAFVGQSVLLENFPVAEAGVYKLVVSAADGGLGTFALTAYLNARREREAFEAISNDTPETAQDLNAAFTTPLPGISRATVLGSLDDLFLADFESGADGFTTDNAPAGGLWHLSSGRAVESGHSSGRSFYFGQGEGVTGGGGYGTGTRAAGYLVSPTIALPATGTISLSFNYVLQTGTSAAADQALVQITTDNGATWNSLATYGQTGESSTWRSTASINLSAYAGQAVKLRWSFDTVDAATSGGEGWYVDDVRIQAAAAVSPDYYAFDLSAGDHVSLASWVSGASNINLVLMDANGATLGSAVSDGIGVPATIDQYAVRNTGRYYARLTGPGGVTYTLLLARNAALQRATDHSSAASAQDITASGGVIGHLPAGGLTPYAGDDFESGTTLGPAWSTYSSTTNGRIRVTGQYTTAGGSLALVMDTATIGANLNEAIYTVNLEGATQTTLSFAHASFSDELTVLPASFTGHANGDGIAVSADGVHWQKIWTPPSTLTNWTTYTLDLVALAAQGGIPLGPGFQIKFQQYDGDPLPTDGRGWDNIVVSVNGAGEDFYAMNLVAGQTLTLTTGTPSDGAAEYLNNLDPQLDVYDPLGNLIASDDNSAGDGHNARLSSLLPVSGRYVVRVSGRSAGGDYALSADVKTSENPPPARPNLSPASDTGRSSADDLTRWNNHDAGSALVFSVDDVTPGATVTLYADGKAIGSAVAMSSTVLIATQPGMTLADGRHLFTARQTLPGRGESGDSAALAVTVDATAPVVPTAASLLPTSDSGAAGDGVTNDTTPTLLLSPGSGNFFRLFIDGRQISADYESVAGFTTDTLADGVYDFLYTAIDAAGNVSGLSAPFAVTIRTTRPSAPTAPLALDASSDTGVSNTDNLTNDNTPTFVLPAGLTAYRVYRNGVLISGSFETGTTFTAPVQPAGTADFTFTVVDIAGNESAVASPALSVTIDTSAPAATTAPDLEAASDSGFSNTDNVTNDTTPTFDLSTLPAGTFYRIYRDNVLISGAYETAGTFTTLPQADGAATYSVRVVDAAGNESAASTGLKVTVLTTALPIVPDLIGGVDTGISSSDNVTRFTTPSFTVPNAVTYRIFRDGVEVGGGGDIPFSERTPLSDGIYSYRAIQTDLAGNVSVLSDPLLVTIDATAPATPRIPDLQTASDNGVSTSDNITAVALPVFDLGVGEGNYFWIKIDDKSVTSTVPASTYTSGTALADGVHTISVAATDVAGNSSAFSAVLSFTIDTTPAKAVVQVAELDPQFGGGKGWTRFGINRFVDQVGGSVSLADGRIVSGGMNDEGGTLYAEVYRFMPDGQPDLTFGQNGRA
jgi:hypothetical protein